MIAVIGVGVLTGSTGGALIDGWRRNYTSSDYPSIHRGGGLQIAVQLVWALPSGRRAVGPYRHYRCRSNIALGIHDLHREFAGS